MNRNTYLHKHPRFRNVLCSLMCCRLNALTLIYKTVRKGNERRWHNSSAKVYSKTSPEHWIDVYTIVDQTKSHAVSQWQFNKYMFLEYMHNVFCMRQHHNITPCTLTLLVLIRQSFGLVPNISYVRNTLMLLRSCLVDNVLNTDTLYVVNYERLIKPH